GAFRLKYRRDRRLGLPLESPLVFYPRYWGGIAVKAWKYSSFFLNTRRILNEVLKAPDRYTYSDLAIAPPKADEFEQLSLYHATSGGEAALARKKIGDDIRESVPAAAAE
ncbi:MAG: radical SAM protein, partial [Roseiarcus sp.]